MSAMSDLDVELTELTPIKCECGIEVCKTYLRAWRDDVEIVLDTFQPDGPHALIYLSPQIALKLAILLSELGEDIAAEGVVGKMQAEQSLRDAFDTD